MIEPQELRLGNYIMDEEGEICTVTGFDSERSFHHDGQNKTYRGAVSLHYGDWRGSIGRWLEKCKPIELTEEWLWKLGFEKKAEHNFRLKVFTRSIIHAYTHGKVEIELGNITGYSFGYPQVYYVHQLQNLYFALTGEELTIKEQK